MRNSSELLSAESLVLVLIGPGGVGKGTVAKRLAALDPQLWLSRSWTTRAPRSNEDGSEYDFVDRATFENAISEGRFLEWASFQGNLYGTPSPDPFDPRDVLLEIEVQGAEQVRQHRRGALVVLIEPPTMSELLDRLRSRGDSEEHIARRLSSTPNELERGRALADHVVVNDEIERASGEILSILEERRRQRRNLSEKEESHGRTPHAG